MCKNRHARLLTVLIRVHELRITIYNSAIKTLAPTQLGLLHLFRCMINESKQNLTQLWQMALAEGWNIAPGQLLSALLRSQHFTLCDFEERVVMRAYQLALRGHFDNDMERIISDHHAELKISSNLIKGCLQPQMAVN